LIGINGFGAAEVLVDQWIHDLVTQGVQPLSAIGGPVWTQIACGGIKRVLEAVHRDNSVG
jgi:hypothetical protein